MVKQSINTRRNHAFVVRPSDIKELWKVLEGHFGPVIVSAECSDDVKREFNKLDEFLSYDNAPTRRIVSLSLRSEPDDWWAKRARINFSSSTSGIAGISIEIREQERVDSEIKDKIFNAIAGLKPWYFFLTPRAFSFDRFASLLIYSLIGLGIFIGLFFGLGEPTWQFLSLGDASKSTKQWFFLFLSLVAGFCLMGLNELRVRIFPLCSFALGQGERRYETGESVRRGFITVLVGSLAAALFSLIW